MDLDTLVPLFDAYRVFYEKPSDPDGARAFLKARIVGEESVVFVATVDGAPAGFTQLYPSFSSVSMAPIQVLNDLFVHESARRAGVAKALLVAAIEYARVEGAVRLALSTAHTNVPAQALYERYGWTRDDEYLTYEYTL
jgi:GNAT superfamily N-acetyltransferase